MSMDKETLLVARQCSLIVLASLLALCLVGVYAREISQLLMMFFVVVK